MALLSAVSLSLRLPVVGRGSSAAPGQLALRWAARDPEELWPPSSNHSGLTNLGRRSPRNQSLQLWALGVLTRQDPEHKHAEAPQSGGGSRYL